MSHFYFYTLFLGFTEIPVAAVIEGFVTNNPNSIKHEYNFYEFRTFVERKTDLYVVCFFNKYIVKITLK